MGDSATGKTTLRKVLGKSKKIVQIDIGNKAYSIEYDIPDDLSRYLAGARNTIFIIDENRINLLNSNDNARAVQSCTDCYFILISRRKVDKLNIDIHDIKMLMTDKSIIMAEDYLKTVPVNNLRQGNMINTCILEDTGQAKDWFNKLFCKSVTISNYKGGKSSFCNEIDRVASLEKDSNILLLFDSISFGSYIYSRT